MTERSCSTVPLKSPWCAFHIVQSYTTQTRIQSSRAPPSLSHKPYFIEVSMGERSCGTAFRKRCCQVFTFDPLMASFGELPVVRTRRHVVILICSGSCLGLVVHISTSRTLFTKSILTRFHCHSSTRLLTSPQSIHHWLCGFWPTQPSYVTEIRAVLVHPNCAPSCCTPTT